MNIIDELYAAAQRTKKESTLEECLRSQVCGELWEKVSSQAGEDTMSELWRACHQQIADAERKGFRDGFRLGVGMMSELL